LGGLAVCRGGHPRWKGVRLFGFSRTKAAQATEEDQERAGGWYSDPFGTAARRWYDNIRGWTDDVQGEGREPDKTGVARLDEAAAEPLEPATSAAP
jgi:hypothetical protein